VGTPARRREPARADRVLPGIWRLRLPLPWPGVPHVNAFAVESEDGLVLFDTGYAGEDGTRPLELALAQAGYGIADVGLLVCTHAHTDHYGLAGPIVDAAGCELWIHPAWEHVRGLEDPDTALERRIEVARQSGVPAAALEQYRKARRGEGTGLARAIPPDRELVRGVEVPTGAGAWQVHETPGHAPSHVVLHQPQRGLLISGDHLLGRVSPFFDHGHTPDPVGEFLESLDLVEGLEVKLCLAGHGQPFRDATAKIAANRELIDEHLSRVQACLDSEGKTAFEIVPDLIGPDNLSPATIAWGIQMTLAYLDHLAARGSVAPVADADPRAWVAISASRA
jgi:glyoxylase-like metal-dependent hydrolase (beta-lactamase superfamily II)